MACRAVKSSPSVSRDFLGEVAHYLIIGGAVEVRVGVANLPRFKQDRYCESRESLVRILHVSHSLPKARPVEKAVMLLDDDVVDLLVIKSPLVIWPQGIEDKKLLRCSLTVSRILPSNFLVRSSPYCIRSLRG